MVGMEVAPNFGGTRDGLKSGQSDAANIDGDRADLPPLRDADPSKLHTMSISRTIGEGDFSLLTNLTWLTGEAHVNATMGPGATDSRVLPPVICAAVGLGLGWTRTLREFLVGRFSFRPLASKTLTIVAGTPLRPGDSIRVESQVESIVEVDDSSALVQIRHEVFNHRGENVVTLIQDLEIAKK
jgi:hypothetical protein